MKRQIQRFAIAGVVGFTVDASVLFLALLGGLGYLAGRLVSFLAAAYVTWQINRRFAFRGSRKEKSHGQWWRYLAVMALGGGLISLSTALSFTCLATAPCLYCWPPPLDPAQRWS